MSEAIEQAEQERQYLLETYIKDKRYSGIESAADGVNHIAFITEDLEKTIDFYCNIVGLKLLRIRTMDGDAASTQVFFDMGRGELLAFLKLSSINKRVQMGTGGVHHFALTVSREQYAGFKQRVEAAGIKYQSISHEILDSISALDPNGLEVELSVWNIDPAEVSQAGA